MPLRNACLLLLLAQLPEGTGTPSKHRPGPHGLEGWTLNSSAPKFYEGALPRKLVLARRGRVLQTIEGSPFVWAWEFRDDGREVALESGPLHFSMTCYLYQLRSGKLMATYDCFKELPPDAPAWVTHLMSPEHQR